MNHRAATSSAGLNSKSGLQSGFAGLGQMDSNGLGLKQMFGLDLYLYLVGLGLDLDL